MDANDVDRQLKQLELEKHTEELRQLRANGRIRWITPTALAALLPLLAGFGLWTAGEMKQYSEGYRKKNIGTGKLTPSCGESPSPSARQSAHSLES